MVLAEALKYPLKVVKPAAAVPSKVTVGVISKEGGVGGGDAELGGRLVVPIAGDPLPPHPNSGPVVTHRPNAINNSRRVAVDSNPAIYCETTTFGA